MKMNKTIKIKATILLAVVITVTMLISISSVVNGQGTQRWEYLIVQYSQSDSDIDNNREEFIFVDGASYDFDVMGCTSLFDYDCLEENAQGTIFYLNAFGADGWELVTVDNQSTQYMYQVEWLFKRPQQ